MAKLQDSRASEHVSAAFPHDPRGDANAHLRATDADRHRVQEVVAAAYADGRLDRAEFDERLHAVATARTLGELPSGAVWAFITISAITWLIWWRTSGVESFPWPAIVSVVFGLRAVRTATSKKSIVAEHTRRLERKTLEPPEEDA